VTQLVTCNSCTADRGAWGSSDCSGQWLKEISKSNNNFRFRFNTHSGNNVKPSGNLKHHQV